MDGPIGMALAPAIVARLRDHRAMDLRRAVSIALFTAFGAHAATAAVVLDAPATGELASANAPRAANPGRQIGYARALPTLATAAGMAQQLEWAKLPGGGTVAALTVRSPGAAALRVGLRIGALPEAAVLRFYPPSGTPTYAVPARDVFATFARNRYVGDLEGAALTYWSPIVEADSVVVEIELPPGADPNAVRVALPVLSHFVVAPADTFASASDAKSSLGTDAANAAVAPTAGSGATPAAKALGEELARAVSTHEGDSFVCPGTLVAKPGAPPIPYFLTSGSCIPSQSAASSMQPFWLVGGASVATLVGGATLLYGGKAAGVSFLQLHAPPPAGARYAQWPGPEVAGFVDDAPVALEQWLGGSAGAAQLATEPALHH